MNSELVTTKRQIFIDASAIKNSSCFRKLWWTIFEGNKPDHKDEVEIGDNIPEVPKVIINRRDYKMAFGSAWHYFLEDYYSQKNIVEGAKRALAYYQPYNDNLFLTPREYRTISHLSKGFGKYKEHYPRIKDGDKILLAEDDFHPLIDSLGAKAVEYKFSIPVWGNDYFDLFLSGTIDLVCSYCGIPIILVDHKTKGVKSFDDYEITFDEYCFDVQMMLYSKVFRDLNKLDYYPNVMINGIFVKYPTKEAEKMGIWDGVKFKRSYPIAFTEEQMFWFEAYLRKKLDTVIYYLNNINNPLVDPVENFEMGACRQWGLCEYFDACSATTKEFRDIILATKFVKKQYNPLKFRE